MQPVTTVGKTPPASGDSSGTIPLVASLACGEVRGGNQPVHTKVSLPGIEGVLYSHPSDGTRGGDVHYLSVCGSGLLARVCVADVGGHGDAVAAVSAQMHAHLRRSVDIVDERRVFAALDRRLVRLDVPAITTAVLLTYYTPSRRLTVSYAGHPPGWILRRPGRRWERLVVADDPQAARPTGLPLGTGLDPVYSRRKLRPRIGDRLVLVTDGAIEAPATGTDEEFGTDGIAGVLSRFADASCAEIAEALLDALRAHTGTLQPRHDDVTVFVGEFVPGPPGPAVWHVLKNRLLKRILPGLE